MFKLFFLRFFGAKSHLRYCWLILVMILMSRILYFEGIGMQIRLISIRSHFNKNKQKKPLAIPTSEHETQLEKTIL